MGRRESPRRKEVRSFRCGGLAGGDIRPRPAEVSCGWQTVSRSSCTPLPGFPNCRSICAHRAGWREARSSRPTRRVEFAPRAWEIDVAGNGRRNLECNAENNKHDGAPDWDCRGDLRGRGQRADGGFNSGLARVHSRVSCLGLFGSIERNRLVGWKGRAAPDDSTGNAGHDGRAARAASIGARGGCTLHPARSAW